MKRFALFFLAGVCTAAGCAVDDDEVGSVAGELDSLHDQGQPEPPGAKVHWARNHARPSSGGGSPDLTYHHGPIMTTGAVVQAIYWGTRWADPDFVGDKRAGLKAFYEGMGGTAYDLTNHEYWDDTGALVGTDVISLDDLVDTSAAPKSGSRTSPILAEVCSQISQPVPNGYYPVYVDTPRGHAGYCAWHSYGTCNGVPVQFAFFFNLDGDAGCDPGDTESGSSQGLAALANVSGHELSEALTDPHLNAWYDSGGAENSDKCAWAFGPTLIRFSNGSLWKIQGNWSNAAYHDSARGYPNRSGQKGCIDGGTYP